MAVSIASKYSKFRIWANVWGSRGIVELDSNKATFSNTQHLSPKNFALKYGATITKISV